MFVPLANNPNWHIQAMCVFMCVCVWVTLIQVSVIGEIFYVEFSVLTPSSTMPYPKWCPMWRNLNAWWKCNNSQQRATFRNVAWGEGDRMTERNLVHIPVFNLEKQWRAHHFIYICYQMRAREKQHFLKLSAFPHLNIHRKKTQIKQFFRWENHDILLLLSLFVALVIYFDFDSI